MFGVVIAKCGVIPFVHISVMIAVASKGFVGVNDREVEDVSDEVVDCAIMVPSLFLSEGVMSMEDEPLVDAPQDMIDVPHLPVDKLQVMSAPYTPSFEKTLEEIKLFEYDGSYRGKKENKSMKRRYTHVESICAIQDRYLCSRRLLKDG